MKTSQFLIRINRIAKTLLIGFLIISSKLSLAQYGYFEQGYGTSNDEEGFDIQVTSTYNVFMTGSITQGGNKDVYIVYADSIGDTVWTKAIGGDGDEVGRAVWQRNGSSWFIGGYTNSKGGGGYDPYFIKIESNGNPAFDVALGANDDEYVFDIAQTNDGYFILVGYSNVGGTDKEILVIKVDSTNGNAIWLKTYGGTGNQEGRAVLTKANGNIVITGTDYNGLTPQAFLLELDSGGIQSTYQKLNQTFPSYATAIVMDKSGGYWLAGHTVSGSFKDALIANVNSSGLYLSHSTFGGSSGNEEFTCITRVGNALFMAGNTTSYGEGGTELYFVATDSVGNLLYDDFAGGVETDYANGIFHRNGLIYLVGYNNSFGVSESGNLYQARVNVYELAGVIASTNDNSTLTPIEEDCTMPRVLYVETMFGQPVNSNYKICTWCGSGDFTIAESELLDSSIYKGVIGNPDREQRLLDFCLLHGFNQVYFYNNAHLFWNPFRQLNNSYTVSLTGGGSKNLVIYMQEKMHSFLTNAYKNYYIDYVGLVGASFVDSANNYNIYFNTQQYNLFANTFNYYNYSFAGKLKQVVLEHEFWTWGEDNPTHTLDTAYFNQRYIDHKTYLKRMLTLYRNDHNIRHIDDYIAWTYNKTEASSPSRDSIELAKAQELELLQDSVFNRKYVTRFFLTYDLNSRWPFIPDSNTCGSPNVNFSIWGRETPYIPWHRDDYSYRTMMFGHRPNNKITQVYPIFYGNAGCLDSRLTKNTPKNDDNTLGFWLGVVDPGNTTEQRTLARAEQLFTTTFSQNTHYNHTNRGTNLKLNGFTYFTFELFDVVNELNIANNYTNNFSDNHATGRIEQNDTFSNNACWYNIPENGQGQFGTVNPGKVERKNPKSLIDINAYPNPVKAELTYEIKTTALNTEESFYTVELFDAMGRNCYHQQATASGKINTNGLPTGIYYLRVVQTSPRGGVSANKIVFIQR